MRRIGIDLGGTKTEILLSGEDPREILQRQRVWTQQEKGYDFIVQQLADLINTFQSFCEEKPRIGMGIPGSISQKTGLIRNANTQCLIGKPFKHDLETLVNNEIFIENDANCFALSEALLGAGQGYRLVLGIIMGTGMGGGVVYEGKLWPGLHGNAGEWGHSSIDYDGPKCWCGQKGCLELYLSGTGIQRMYQEQTGMTKTLQEIYQASAQESDPAAMQVMADFLFYFGRGLANLVTSFDPEIIVIGGGVSNLPILYREGIEAIRSQLFNDEFKTPIVPASLGDSSGIFGAAMLAG